MDATGIAGVLASAAQNAAARNSDKSSKTNAAQQTLLERLRAENAEQYKAIKDKLDAQNQLVRQLEGGKKDLRTQQKEAARAKLDSIRQQLQTLQLSANADDPATRKQLARLSRELAAAKQAYSAAGGNAGADIAGGNPNAAAEAQADADFNKTADSISAALKAMKARKPESADDSAAETGEKDEKPGLSDIII